MGSTAVRASSTAHWWAITSRPAQFALVAALLFISSGSALSGSRLTPGPDREWPPSSPPVFVREGGCTTGQTNNINAQAGIDGPERLQNPCRPGFPSGSPDDLTGFAFVLHGCMNGGIGEIALLFQIADIGDEFFLFVWRDFGGLPNDACGLAPFGALEFVKTKGPFFSIYDICDFAVPIADDERIFVGVIYRHISEVFGADWFFGRNDTPGFTDRAYVNLSGNQGDWEDLAVHGLDNRWGIVMTNLSTCGPLAVEQTSWGAVKAILR